MLKTKNLDFSWVSSDVKVISHVGLGDSRNLTHSRKMSGYAIANPTYGTWLMLRSLEGVEKSLI
jgi:hypothetical protein